MDQSDLPTVIITIIIVFTILFLGTYTGGQVIAATDSGGTERAAPQLDGTQWVKIDSGIGQNERVVDSRGYAINTTGSSDSYWRSTEDVTIAQDDTWTISAWARVDPASASDNMTVLSVNGRVVITYNGTDSEWRAWYYDDGSTQSYEVSVAAPAQPSTFVQLYVVRNSTTLTIYQNTTQGTTANVTESSQVSAPTNATGFDGRTDEVRAFDDALNASQRQSLHADPVRPLVANRTARVMFDQPQKSSQLLFYNPGKILTSNETYSSGLSGEVLNGAGLWNDITGSTDYRWDTVGPRIKPVDGGALEHAPVAYVRYDQQSQFDALVGDWTAAMQLASVLFVLLPLGVIVVYLRGVRGSR